MAEAARHERFNIAPELMELRLLTEPEHLLAVMDAQGNVSRSVLEDVRTNLKTAVYEIAMPEGVSTTIHQVEHSENAQGQRQLAITWLGKRVVESVVEGKKFHFSKAAHERVDVETAEAQHAERSLRPGVAQLFISPKMTSYDAPAAIAKAEHLYEDDSLRVSYPVTNSQGEVVSRRLESLLVRDIPIEAWVAMLQDEHNIFGKSFVIKNTDSALSVMRLFDQLDLPIVKLPEGPITLVAEVQKYIKDNEAYDSVDEQLAGYRHNQVKYQAEAERAAEKWLEFELELARSLKWRRATLPVKAFIVSLQDRWNDDQREITNTHQLQNAEFTMTRQLAAVLESAKRQLLNNKSAIAVGNKRVLSQLGTGQAQELKDRIESLEIMYANRVISGAEYHRQQAELDRDIASKNLRSGSGGCAEDAFVQFRRASDDPSGSAAKSQEDDWQNGERKWKKGVCQVKVCVSPRPTEVGPCSVCKRCQDVFDSGGDPTKPALASLLLKRMTETPESKRLFALAA